MLDSIKNILDRITGENQPDEDEKQYPFNLSEAEVAVLKKLYGTDMWTVLQKVVDETAKLQNERMLSTDDTDELHDSRGYIRGARAPLKTIAFIIQQEKSENERRRSERQRERREQRRTRDVATYGHPARESEQRRRARSE